MSRNVISGTALGVVIALTGLSNPTAFAQAVDETGADEVDTIIVTATKRETTLDETPVAVSVVTSADIENAGVFDLQSVQQLVPSLTITTSTTEIGGASIKLRGVGTNANNFSIEPSVGVFVDGVYLNRSGIALNDVFDVENIQVLRGPQSTLFGKNTSAGAVLLSTKAPSFDQEAEVNVTLGEHNLQRYNAVVNLPVVDDTLAVRLGAQHLSRDGYMEDLVTGNKYNDRDRWLVRGQALWEPIANLSFRLIADISNKDEACCVPTLITDASPRSATIRGLGGEVGDASDPYSTAVSIPPRSEVDEWGLSLTTTSDFDFGEMVLIFAHRDYEGRRQADVDYNSLDIFSVPEQELESKFTTAEVYFQGTAGRVEWLVGGFFSDESLRDEGATVFGPDTGAYFSQLVPAPFRPLIAGSYPAGGGQTQVNFTQKGESFALYTHNVIALSDNTDLTLGLRYSDGSKSGTGRFETTNNPSCQLPAPLAALRLGCPVPDYDEDFEDDKVTGTAALLHQFTDDLSVFGSYSRGVKSGGINFNRTAVLDNTVTIGSETSDNYEIGLRTNLDILKSKLTLVGFYTDYKDYQLNTLDPTSGTFRFTNEGEVTSKGVEVEWSSRPIEGLNVGAAVTYAHARFADDVPNPTFAGNPPNNAPKWTGNFNARYARPLSDNVTGFVSGNLRYQSDQFTSASLDPNSKQEAYTITNLRAGLMLPRIEAEVALFANNVFDVDYKVISFPTPQLPGNWSAFVGEPRMIGANLKKSF